MSWCACDCQCGCDQCVGVYVRLFKLLRSLGSKSLGLRSYSLLVVCSVLTGGDKNESMLCWEQKHLLLYLLIIEIL